MKYRSKIMGEVRINLEYTWYILKHKYYVAIECLKMRLYWQGVIHDTSKFSVHEFRQYRDMYTRPRITGEARPHTLYRQFDIAWLHHIHNNPHHWEYWVLDGKAIDMPNKYIKEMVCDWHGVGLAINGKKDTASWYKSHKGSINISDKTRRKVERLLESDQKKTHKKQ